MYKIGDFSQLGQVSPRMLRHYDKLGLLKPGHTDEWTGYRFYTIEQLPRLNRIVVLRELGFSLGEIGEMLEEVLPKQLEGLYEKRKRQVEEHLRAEAIRLQRISQRILQIQQEGTLAPPDVSVKRLGPETVIGVRQMVPQIDQMGIYRSRAITDLYAWLDEHNYAHHGERVVYFNGEYSEENIDMLFGVAVDPAATIAPPTSFIRHTLPASHKAAGLVHRGSLHDIPDVISSLYRWIGLNGYSSVGAFREIHHFGREDEVFASDQRDDVVFEIILPVEKL